MNKQCNLCNKYKDIASFQLVERKYRRSSCKICQKGINRFGCCPELILERDNYQCQACGMTNDEHTMRWKRRLTIDHRDGKGRNSKCKNNNASNLVTLCLICHGRKDHRPFGVKMRGFVV